MNKSFILRQASLSDIDEIMKIESKGFIPEIQEERQVFEQRVLINPDLFIIFETPDKKVAGYLSAEYLNKMPETSEELALGHIPASNKEKTEIPLIYISSFSILPEYRGCGNGSSLWNMSLTYLQQKVINCSFVLLVNSEWKEAFHIYEKSGFTKIKIFEKFFPASEGKKTDGILMRK